MFDVLLMEIQETVAVTNVPSNRLSANMKHFCNRFPYLAVNVVHWLKVRDIKWEYMKEKTLGKTMAPLMAQHYGEADQSLNYIISKKSQI